ncbi:expressed unknown protein [Seminavis robusta]|uniref:Uncharacterized protein n=1 Tax=Seminavis robusta TaxID=568900 RepID=A0A9N8F2H9_9STRA|nr:expressed unknown protein [Seminavis robusta]|eukprot:Sro2426_g327320.1 n/a (406) ;mRNA; r:11048-12265
MTQLAAAIPNPSSPKTQKKSLKEVMNESTIYRRHQARLLKNMEKKDDPRPKAVRVLGGLPGFRTFSPEYEAPGQEVSSQSSWSIDSPGTSAPTAAFTFQEDATVFQSQAAFDENPMFDNPTALPRRGAPPHYSVLTAGALGALAEACYGSTMTKKSVGNVSPFRKAMASSSLATDRATVPLLQEHANVSFFRLHAAFSNAPSVNAQSTARAATKSQLVAGASTASLLFGTKALADEFLARRGDTEEAVKFSPVSSAVAGAAVAAISLIEPTEAKLLRNPMSTPTQGVANRLMQQNLLPRHILGATIYFSSYEMMKSILASNASNVIDAKNGSSNSNSPSIITVALSGAIAGALYQGTLLYNTSTLALPMQQQQARLAPYMIRAAPAHALLFIGYEWIQQGHKKQH